MKILGNVFNSKSFQKPLMISAIAIGGAGLLSGVWLASFGNPAGMAGLIGGTITLAIGYFGLLKLGH